MAKRHLVVEYIVSSIKDSLVTWECEACCGKYVSSCSSFSSGFLYCPICGEKITDE
jgi:hypothetical protein